MTNLNPIIAEDATSRDIIAMMAEVEIVAAAMDEGDKPAGPPKFKVRAYNGGALTLNYWDYPVAIDLAGMTFATGITANLHHHNEAIVGHVTEPSTDGKTLDLNGLVSGTGDGAKEFLGNAANGFPWQASIEASPTTKPDFVGEGEKVTVNGRELTGPLYVVRKSELYGIAFLPRGADSKTKVTLAAAAANPKEIAMDPKLKAFILEMGGNPDTISPEALIKAKASFEGSPTPVSEPSKKLQNAIEAARAEDERQSAIADLTATAIADNPGCGSQFINALEALAQKAIEAKWSKEKYDTELLRATRPQNHTVFAPRGERDNRITNDVLMAAICISGGLKDIDKRFKDETLQSAHDQFPNGVGLKQLIMMAAKARGYRGDGWDVNLEAQRYAFGQVPGMGIQAGFSTLSLPGIFSNSLNKFLLEGWGASDMAWQEIASRRNVRDFKQVSSYRLGGTFKYIKVGPTGEIKDGQVGESTYTNQAETYGIRFAITRTDIINDDLSALTQIPREMGFGAADSLNEVFWTEFLNNSAFFVAGNNNVSTGAGSALGIPGLTAAEVVFMAQTKPNGQPLAVMPTILLVPSALKRTALSLMNSQLVVSGNTALAGGLPSGNTFSGNFKVVSSPFLSNANFTGYSASAWYLLADPSRLSTIEMAFLNGKEAPTVEEAVAENNVLGMSMRAYMDFGCNQQEPRAGVRSAGS